MSQLLTVHPDDPQLRLITQAVQIIRQGGIAVYPTDSGYALGCQVGNKQGQERIRGIRQLDKHHNFTLVCRDLTELGTYAYVSNSAYRLIKRHTPGPYTFILKATSDVPKRLMHPKRRTIGLRVPANAISQSLLAQLEEPLMSVSWILPNESQAPLNTDHISPSLKEELDLLIDGGFCPTEPTSVIDLTANEPYIIRHGRGDVSLFEV